MKTGHIENYIFQLEAKRQNEYFGILEKKEAMEEKMSSVTTSKCKSFTCFQVRVCHLLNL